MELGRFRDLSRIYILIMGAFSMVFFAQYMTSIYLSADVAGARACGSALIVFLVLGFVLLWFGLEKWDRFYTDMTVPPPAPPAGVRPYHPPIPYYPPPGYFQPHPGGYPRPAQYPAPRAYYAPPRYPYPETPPPVQRAPPPAAPPQMYPPPPAYFASPPGYPPAQPYYTAPPPPGPVLPDADPGRALILPNADRLLTIFLVSVLLGAVSLALGPYTGWLSLMLFPPAFIIGFSFPSLIWISYVYSFEKKHILPSKAILKALTYGMLSTIPALVINTLAGVHFGYGPDATLFATLMVVAVVAPFVEEFAKPWGLLLVKEETRGRLDGLIFGVTCGVGFALIENISYELSFLQTGESAAAVWSITSLARGLGSIMVHATGAGMIGYAYGRYRASGDISLIPPAYIVAVIFHALWNGSSVVFAGVTWGLGAQMLFMVFFIVGAFFLLNELIERGAVSEAARPP